MDGFFFLFDIATKKKNRAFFRDSLLEGAYYFMKEENDQDIINNLGSTWDQNVRKEQWSKLYNQNSDKEFL